MSIEGDNKVRIGENNKMGLKKQNSKIDIRSQDNNGMGNLE